MQFIPIAFFICYYVIDILCKLKLVLETGISFKQKYGKNIFAKCKLYGYVYYCFCPEWLEFVYFVDAVNFKQPTFIRVQNKYSSILSQTIYNVMFYFLKRFKTYKTSPKAIRDYNRKMKCINKSWFCVTVLFCMVQFLPPPPFPIFPVFNNSDQWKHNIQIIL